VEKTISTLQRDWLQWKTGQHSDGVGTFDPFQGTPKTTAAFAIDGDDIINERRRSDVYICFQKIQK